MQQDRTTNVTVGDWISVGWVDDASIPPELRARSTLGLRELLDHAHHIASIDVPSPSAAAALYRVLYALAIRVTRTPSALGLDDLGEGEADWEGRRQAILNVGRFAAESIDDYFQRFADRFDICDARHPFLQDPRLVGQCTKTAGLNKLVPGRPAGNNHRWFGGQHRDDDPLPVTVAEAFLGLLTQLYYGASGRCSTRDVAGLSKANTRSGPLRSTLSYHPVGSTLFATLVAGIPMPDDDLTVPDDPCPWERDDLPDPTGAPPRVRGVCSLLTARAQHAVLLVPGADRTTVVDAYITWAFREAVPSPPDPFLIWHTSKKGEPYARQADSGRALWRDMDALLSDRPSASTPSRRPRVFTELPGIRGLRVQGLGFHQDGQAKDTQFVTALTPPIWNVLTAEKGSISLRIGDLHQAARTAGQRLDFAVKRAWATFANEKTAGECAWSQHAAAGYWPLAEDEFWARLFSAEPDAFDELGKAFRALAVPIYNEITFEATATQRGARAVELARFELYGGRPKKARPPRPKEDPQS